MWFLPTQYRFESYWDLKNKNKSKLDKELIEDIKKFVEQKKSFVEIDELLGLRKGKSKYEAGKLGIKSKYKKKEFIKKECLECLKEFESNKTENRKFCSRNCSGKYIVRTIPNRKIERICTRCDKKVKSHRHSLCKEHHVEYIETRFDYIKELTLEDYWAKKSLQNLHSSSKNAHIRSLCRSWLKHLSKLPCHNCGYDKHVELCHIKAIREFTPQSKLKEVNSEDNVIQLCPNCHWEFDKGLLKLK